MGKSCNITPQAQRDFDRAFWWYEEQYRGLGKEFVHCVDIAITNLQRNPEHFQIIYKDLVRRALVRRFPYAVYFVNKPEVLGVIAILRQSSNPDRWMSRI